MPDPRQLEFWSQENAHLWDDLAPVIIQIYLSGAESGIELLPPDLQPLVNWDTFNAGVIRFLNDYRLHTLTGITQETRTQVVAAIDEWIRGGEALNTLIAKLTPLLGAQRAEMIAITEVTRVYAEGNLASWRSTGLVSAKRWNTAKDERVCLICRPLSGQIVSLDGGFTTEVSGFEAREIIPEMVHDRDIYNWNGHPVTLIEKFGITFYQIGITAPPAHPRCRCWLTPVVSQEALIEEIEKILNA